MLFDVPLVRQSGGGIAITHDYRLIRPPGYSQLKLPAGIASALAAGALFGTSTPLAKRLVADVDPWMLAGLLYLGSGLGLGALRAVQKASPGAHQNGTRLQRTDRWWLAAAISAGGIIAPVLMIHGLRLTAASSASLLLNLEGVFSVLLAWFAFRENFGRRVVLGMLAITAAAMLLSVKEGWIWSGVTGPALIAGACFAWALDNNLTRRVALSDVMQIAMLKGLAAGAMNVSIAFALGAALPRASAVFAAAAVGLCGYGVSLVLFVLALRHLGTARTSAYFSIAPFVGALISVAFLKEPLTMQLVLAGALMALGLWLHVSERHEHEHTHEPMRHDHPHAHDEHHQHDHSALGLRTEPHSHAHTHEPMRHTHPHYPDAHHRHVH
jgi:drug/metabolite transporter (DMT)-like permease